MLCSPFITISSQNKEIASGMMKKVISLMWHKKEGDNIFVNGRGLIIRPELGKYSSEVRDEYKKLIDNINDLLEGNK